MGSGLGNWGPGGTRVLVSEMGRSGRGGGIDSARRDGMVDMVARPIGSHLVVNSNLFWRTMTLSVGSAQLAKVLSCYYVVCPSH